ncbi:MAG: hypothetical protein ACI89T_002416 [Cognaticolwellia sp.]|jgi:hypothetical protein
MTKHNILFIGLDTHKTFTEVAYIEEQRGAKSIHLGKTRQATTIKIPRCNTTFCLWQDLVVIGFIAY